MLVVESVYALVLNEFLPIAFFTIFSAILVKKTICSNVCLAASTYLKALSFINT
jgi:hypothetical protein